MRLCFEGDRFHLAGGQTVGLRDQPGAQLEVLDGQLWVTQEGDRRDVVLHHGERFRLERRGTTVLHALTPVQIRVEPRRREGRWWHGLRRRLTRRLDDYYGEQRARSAVVRL